MPFVKGTPKPANSGRKSGQKAKITTIREMMQAMGARPGEYSVRIVMGDVPCGVCHGEGTTKYQPAKGSRKTAKRTCESCYGSGKERLSPELRQKADAELMKYCQPQLKAIEVTGADGDALKTRHEIVFVKPQPLETELA